MRDEPVIVNDDDCVLGGRANSSQMFVESLLLHQCFVMPNLSPDADAQFILVERLLDIIDCASSNALLDILRLDHGGD